MPSARHIASLSTLGLTSFLGAWLSAGAGFAAADEGASAQVEAGAATPAAARPLPSPAIDLPRAAIEPPPSVAMKLLDGDAPGSRARAEGTRQQWIERVRGRRDALCEQASAAGARRSIAVASPRLERAIGGPPSGTRVSVHVRDLRSGETLADREGELLLNPASNQKLATSIAAVELLGADYVFETRVLRDSDTLYLVGEGDPSLREADLYSIAREVADSSALTGIERIVVDDHAFSAQRFGPGYDADGEGVSYMAPSGALSLHFNTVVVQVAPGAVGEAAAVEILPASDHLRVDNLALTGAGRSLTVDSYGEAGQTVIRVRGAIAGGRSPRTIRRRISDPAAFTGEAFAEVLSKVTGQPRLAVSRGEAPESQGQALAVHRSKPLIEVLSSALKYSNNFTSEQVLRTLAWRATGEPGAFESGVATVRDLAGCLGEREQMQPVNGSGLSREGRASARALVDLLALAERDGSPTDLLLTAFARAGGEGTLRHRLGHAGARVRAKTGTISGASALSGVASSADGRRLVGFSVLVNGGEADSSRAYQDRVVSALLDELDAPDALDALASRE